MHPKNIYKNSDDSTDNSYFIVFQIDCDITQYKNELGDKF